MIEVWVEDSTAGYRMAKQIIETKFNKLIKVIPHAGIGRGASTKECPYGGILRHLDDYISKSYNNTLVLLLIDSVYDNDSVRSSIKDIKMVIRNKNNIQLLKQQTCFEMNLISYDNILSMCGKLNNNEIANLKIDAMQYKNSKKAYTKELQYIIDTHKKPISIEGISKEVLHIITQQNKKCIYKGKHIDPTDISGEKMGYCWTRPCCYLEKVRINNTCNKEYYSFKFKRADKIRDIYTYSNYNNILNEIEVYIKEYFKSFYRVDTKYEQNYKSKLWKHCKQNSIDIYKYIDSCINNYSIWNYQLICKRLGIK